MKKIILAVIAILLVIFMVSRCYANKPVVITDVNKYGEFYGFKGQSNLNVFPENTNSEIYESEYYFEYIDRMFDPCYQIYLKCKYDKEKYLKEIGRLLQVNEQHQGKIQEIKYDADNFKYPAYVSIFADSHCYEYALLDEEEYTIIYVYTQFAEEQSIRFDKSYLPFDYMGEVNGAFSIYKFERGDGTRYISNKKYKS